MATLFLALPLLAWQLWSASGQVLWTDEQYSIHVAFTNPWSAYFMGDTLEGNSSPLFFLLLKLFVTLTPYVPFDPVLWLRLLSVVPSWIAFLVFSGWLTRNRNGWRPVLLGLAPSALFFFHPSFNHFHWQCRPYGLWILFTTMQAIEVMDVTTLRRPFSLGRWAALSFALCATIPIAPIQIGAAGLCLLLSPTGRAQAKAAFLAAAPSVALCLLWKSALKDAYSFAWPGWIEARHLVFASLRPKQLVVPFACGIFLGLWRAEKRFLLLRLFALQGMNVLGAAGILAIFYLFYRPTVRPGFELPSRYFLFLFPVTLVTFSATWRSLPGKRAALLYPVLSLLTAASFAGEGHWVSQSRLPDPAVAQLRSLFASQSSACHCFFDPTGEVPRHVSAELSLALLQANSRCQGPYLPLQLSLGPQAKHPNPIRLAAVDGRKPIGALDDDSCVFN